MVFDVTHIYDVHMYITIELKQIKNDTDTVHKLTIKIIFKKIIRHTCVQCSSILLKLCVQYIITI